METQEDYDFVLHYHPRKANVVAYALSRKNYGQLFSLWSKEFEMNVVIEDFELSWMGRTRPMFVQHVSQTNNDLKNSGGPSL